jgi:integrase
MLSSMEVGIEINAFFGKSGMIIIPLTVTEILNDQIAPCSKTFYSTGCRVSEVAGIRCQDIDFPGRTIRVLGKRKKERIFCFGSMAKEALLAHLGHRREGFLFQDNLQAQKFGVSKDKPNKRESSVWWRRSWDEYPQENGPRVMQWKWLARVSEMSVEEACETLQEIIGSANTYRPKADRPLATRWRHQV